MTGMGFGNWGKVMASAVGRISKLAQPVRRTIPNHATLKRKVLVRIRFSCFFVLAV